MRIIIMIMIIVKMIMIKIIIMIMIIGRIRMRIITIKIIIIIGIIIIIVITIIMKMIILLRSIYETLHYPFCNSIRMLAFVTLALWINMTKSQAHLETAMFCTTCKDSISQNTTQFIPHLVHSINPHLWIHQKGPDFSSVYH